MSPKVIFIVGPTAVGKTDVSLRIASQIPCEIVSCDSMQVYREISVASNKPSATEREKVPHHLLDVVSIEDKFDVVMFNMMAVGAIKGILDQRKHALIVGGSGMYVQILLDGIFEGGKQNAALRKKLESQGIETLYKKLKRVDPDTAAKIHGNDLRRIVRALEVYEITKTPISKLQKQRSGLWGQYPVEIYGINCERGELYDVINRRVDRMFDDGLIDEVRTIADRNLSLTAERIIGIKEVQSYLKREKSLEETKELMKMNTRRFAKRQLTWFRKDHRIKWFMLGRDGDIEAISQHIIKDIS